jgi:hypothetical protein
MYLQGVLPWQSSKWVAPPPEVIERIRQEAGTHEGPVGEDAAPPAGDIASKDSQDEGDGRTEKAEESV